MRGRHSENRSEWKSLHEKHCAGNGAIHPLRIHASLQRHYTDRIRLSIDGGDFSHWARVFYQAKTPGYWLDKTEMGTTETEAGFRALLAMSPYHHIQDGVKYPAVLVATGINDPRVDAWQAAKMAARLQAASASGKPVLFRVEDDAGHGMGATTTQIYAERADYFAFLFWQFGLTGFQPKTN